MMPFVPQETPCPTKYGFQTVRLEHSPDFKPRCIQKELIKVWIEHCKDKQKQEDNPFI